MKQSSIWAVMVLAVVAGCAAREPVERPTTRPVTLSSPTKSLNMATGVREIPTLTAYYPDGARNGTAVVVCPGGGYGGLMDTFEGVDVCRWWNQHGVTAFLLRYHLAPDRYPAALNDAQAAIRYVRQNAKAYGVDSKRIGIMGFSAGGHLAGSAATMFHDKADRPDFAVLVYPVVSMLPPLGHVGSRDNLLGKDHPAEMDEQMSLERRVTDRTPPCFLVHGRNDTIVDWRNSALMDDALRAHGVKERLVILENGPHGFGMRTPGKGERDWTEPCLEFLKAVGVMPTVR